MARTMKNLINITGSGEVRVILYQHWFEMDKRPGGATYETAQDTSRAASYNLKSAILSSHTRSGALAGSFRVDTSRPDRRNVHGFVRTREEHAKWFFGGTRPVIYRADGGYMSLPAFEAYPAIRTRTVRGQKSKQYLLDAAVDAALATISAGPASISNPGRVIL